MSKTDKYPTTFDACLANLAANLLQTLTGHQLAAVVDKVPDTFQAGKLAADREAIQNGCVWDEKIERLVELVA